MNLNKNIIIALSKYKTDAQIKGESFKVRAYDKVIKNIENIKENIISYEQIENIEGAGKSIKAKLKEIINEFKENNKEKGHLFQDLLKIYGVGPKKANDLINIYKISSINDLRMKSENDLSILTNSQKIGLRFYDELLERIPRSEILKHQKIIKKGEIVGSFRRKEPSSGDIDVMLCMGIDEFNEFIDVLIKQNYIKYVLARGDKKMLGICSLNDSSKHRRIDLIRNTDDEYPFMKLYFTGSAKFNVAFRQHCLTKGLSLNEHGFTPPVKGIKTEKDIFKHVGLEYVEPENRIDENSLKQT
jgi:DNA polymerase/3'-5' exonuclease PolX